LFENNCPPARLTLSFPAGNTNRFWQNKLIQRQIGNSFAQPAVLELKVLQALHLLDLQPTLARPIIRHLAYADLTDCVHNVLAL